MRARGDRGASGSPITIGAVLLILLIIALSGIRGRADSSSTVSFSPKIGVTSSSSSSVAPSEDGTVGPTTIGTTTLATTPASTGTSVQLSQGILLVDGDAHAMTNYAQPAPCIVHYAEDGTTPVPDPSCTPGAVSTRVNQDNIAFTICSVGYTDKIRPPGSQTKKAKKIVAVAYNVVGVEGEYDHLVPLELGGANDVRNLWLEPGKVPNPKDAIENKLKALVCAGKITLADAQARIATNWTTALNGLPTK